MSAFECWLWPDRTIGKRESRQLREEHNKVVNAHANLLEVLKLCEGNIASLNATHPAVWGEWLQVVRKAVADGERGVS